MNSTHHTVRQSFNRAAISYAATAKLQQIVADGVIAHVHHHLPSGFTGHLLDAGCGTGYCTRQLQSHYPNAFVVGLDFAEHMLRQLPPPMQPQSLQADIQQLPLADASIDYYVSSLAWQWCKPLAAAQEVCRVLRPDGQLTVATLTTDTFHELATCLQQVGLPSQAHILPFITPQHLETAFHEADLAVRTIRQETITTWHTDFRSLRHSIRGVGANHLPGGNTAPLTRAMRAALLDAFEALRTPQGLPLSYNILIIDAHKKACAS